MNNNAPRRAGYYGGRGFLPAATSTGEDRRQPYTPKPMQFVCSSGDAMTESVKPPSVDVPTEIGQFEIHTRGIGSRLMAKMGFIPGKGLGKDRQGIAAPVATEFKHDKSGLGFLTAAAWPSWDSAKKKMIADATTTPVSANPWERDTCGTEESVWPSWDSAKKKKIADATTTPVSANPWERETSKARGTEEPVWPSWDSAKKKKIADATTTPVSANPWEGETSKARPELSWERKQRNKEKLAGKKMHGDAITAAIDGVKKQQSSGDLTLSSLMETFSDLKKRFTEEFETSDISSIAASFAYPLLVEVFWGWKPDEGEDLLQGLLLMSSWKDLLSSRKDCLDDASAYSNLVRDVVLPVVKEWGANSWNVMDPQPMIAFLELWELLLPQTVRDLILEEVVMTRLLLAVESWDPRVDTPPIHVWMHPWCTLLGTRLDSMCETIQVRMGRVLDSWEPSDQLGFDLLSPWKYVFDSASWEMMMTKYIVPKLKSALKKNKHSLEDQFNWVMRWDSVMPTEQIVILLEDGFFDNWLRALELWFRNSDTKQVSTWFESWKAQFSSALLADERIQVLLSTALSMIDQQKEKEFSNFWDEL